MYVPVTFLPGDQRGPVHVETICHDPDALVLRIQELAAVRQVFPCGRGSSFSDDTVRKNPILSGSWPSHPLLKCPLRAPGRRIRSLLCPENAAGIPVLYPGGVSVNL